MEYFGEKYTTSLSIKEIYIKATMRNYRFSRQASIFLNEISQQWKGIGSKGIFDTLGGWGCLTQVLGKQFSNIPF